MDNGTRVKDVPAGEDRILVELPDEIEEPFKTVDMRFAEDAI